MRLAWSSLRPCLCFLLHSFAFFLVLAASINLFRPRIQIFSITKGSWGFSALLIFLSSPFFCCPSSSLQTLLVPLSIQAHLYRKRGLEGCFGCLCFFSYFLSVLLTLSSLLVHDPIALCFWGAKTIGIMGRNTEEQIVSHVGSKVSTV